MKYRLENVNCLFCGSDNYEIYIKGAKELFNNTGERFDVVKCRNCELIFTNPRPTKDTVGCFYPDSAGYYQPSSLDILLPPKFKRNLLNAVLKHGYNYELEAPYSIVAAHLLKWVFAKRIALMHIPEYIKDGKLLDIGCSWGRYLYLMQYYGWDVYGTEMNEKAVKFAREKLGLKNVQQGFFEDIMWEQDFFHVVNMSMVLEHLYSPLQSLRLLNSIMRRKGQLILSMPDISGIEAKLYGDKCYTLQVPQHITHFSPKTITNFLNSAGFRVEKVVHHRFDRDLVASAGYLNNQLLSRFLQNFLVRKTVVRLIVEVLSLLGRTSRMSIYASKLDA